MKNVSKKNSDFYDKNSYLQKKVAKKIIKIVLEFLKGSEVNFQKKSFNILEIGSGNGNLTFLLLKTLKNFNLLINLTLIEPADVFIDIIKGKMESFLKKTQNLNNFLKINYEQKKVQDFLEKEDKNFNLVVSNFTLHWVEDLDFFLKKLYKIGGFQVFSFPLDESFEALKRLFLENEIDINLATNLPNFKKIKQSLKEIQQTEEAQGKGSFNFLIKKSKVSKKFKNPYEILKFFSQSGYNNLGQESIFQNINFLKKVRKIESSCKLEFVFAIIVIKKS